MKGNDTAKQIWDFLIKNGLTPCGAAGLMGNLQAESGLIPNRVELLCLQRLKKNGQVYTDKTYTDAVDSGSISRDRFLHPLPGRQYGYGIAQWTSPGRKAGLYDLCRKRGVSIGDLETQLIWLMSELSVSYKKVLSVLRSTGTVKEASDYVLCNFERPDDCGASVRAHRAAYGQAFYDTFAGTDGAFPAAGGAVPEANRAEADRNSTGGNKMGVRVANCGHDENNKYSGGKAGDQTGTEWYLRDWYAYPWDYIIRWKDAELAGLFADLAVEAAKNDKIGYDQGQRETFWQRLKAAGYRPAKIGTACEADCSSGTVALIRAVGYLKGIKDLQQCSATYTGNMMQYFRSAAGKKYFTVLTGKYLTDAGLARRGDINLNVQHHVNITVDNGTRSGAAVSSAGASGTGAAGFVGTCTVKLKTFLAGAADPQVKAIQILLNARGFRDRNGNRLAEDGELGEKTAYSIEQLQRKAGMKNINFGTVAAKTWELLLNVK